MSLQYRGVYAPPVPQRSPHGASQRRGGIGPMMLPGPHPQVPLTPAQIAHQQQAQAQANELARRRSRKPTDKNIPDGVEDSIINADGVQRYRDLRELEKRFDATVTRKRIELFDVAGRNTKLQKTLRIWISNTVEDQIWQSGGLNVDAFDFTPNENASYRVKIEGQLIDTEPEESGESEEKAMAMEEDESAEKLGDKDDETAQKPKSNKARKLPFSHFFKAISVEFDRPYFPTGNNQVVEWKKPEQNARTQSSSSAVGGEFDEFTFKRTSDENTNIMIRLTRHDTPERFQLSPELAEVVDMQEATQQEAVMGVWEYIRLMRLQENEEKRNFRCDELLAKVVRRGDIGYIPMLNEYVSQHLRPLSPISLPYTIRVDEDFHKDPQPTVYDVQVFVEDPFRATLLPIINNPQYATMLKEVTGLDDQLGKLIQAISVSKAKHSFFTSLSADPANFVRNWLSSQKRDLEIIMGEATRGGGESAAGDEWRRGGKDSVWATQNARESVNVLLSKQR